MATETETTKAKQGINWAARCECGCMRRDHVHSGQKTQHTPLPADAERDCLGPCIQGTWSLDGVIQHQGCAGFVERRDAEA